MNYQTLNAAPYGRNDLGPAWNWDFILSTHNTPPGLTRQIAIKSPQSTDLHRWYLTQRGSQSLDTDLQHSFYSVATVVLLPLLERRWEENDGGHVE